MNLAPVTLPQNPRQASKGLVTNSFTRLPCNQGSSAYTAIGGHGIYNVRQQPGTGGIYIAGNFLADPGDGSNPGGWSLGADGIAVAAYLAEWSAADLADIAAIVWPWFEACHRA